MAEWLMTSREAPATIAAMENGLMAAPLMAGQWMFAWGLIRLQQISSHYSFRSRTKFTSGS